jgi:hypothetical protein
LVFEARGDLLDRPAAGSGGQPNPKAIRRREAVHRLGRALINAARQCPHLRVKRTCQGKRKDANDPELTG